MTVARPPAPRSVAHVGRRLLCSWLAHTHHRGIDDRPVRLPARRSWRIPPSDGGCNARALSRTRHRCRRHALPACSARARHRQTTLRIGWVPKSDSRRRDPGTAIVREPLPEVQTRASLFGVYSAPSRRGRSRVPAGLAGSGLRRPCPGFAAGVTAHHARLGVGRRPVHTHDRLSVTFFTDTADDFCQHDRDEAAMTSPCQSLVILIGGAEGTGLYEKTSSPPHRTIVGTPSPARIG